MSPLLPVTTAKIPVSPWEACLPAVWNGPGERSPEALRAVAAQFDVEHHPRYAVRDTSGDGRPDTFCNIYLWDVTRALRSEVPHWHGGRELSANAVCDWLASFGNLLGWYEGNRGAAHRASGDGMPVVAAWKNERGGSGHVALLLPPAGDELRIAQAGKRNYFDVPLERGFGALVPRFYLHP